jgi:dTDP-glucose 4,6-dehydratase
MRVLITGAAGFAGSHIAEELTTRGYDVVSLDCLTYAGRLDRLAHLPRNQVKAVWCDFSHAISDGVLKEIGDVDYIIHNGAESHVLRSFQQPRTFAESNIIGTLNVLEAARKMQPRTFIYVSTDEVFGPSHGTPFKETDPLCPTNPYATTKASGEFLVHAYFRSFGLPAVISRTMNMFGERQHPEKCVPLMIKKILRGEPVPIHGTREDFAQGYAWKSGSRHWLHARNQANALQFLLKHGIPGEKYNIGGEERTNLEIFHILARTVGVLSQYEWAHPLGPIHDMNYALDDSKIRAMGWKPPVDFETSLRETVRWTVQNREWLEE